MGADQKKSRRLNLLRGALAAVALAFLARALWQQGPRLLALEPRPIWLVLASAGFLAAFLSQVWAWQWNLRRLGSDCAYGSLFRVYYTMNMARYIPGKVWSLAGTVAFGTRLGVDAGRMSASVFLGLVSSLVSGVLVGFAMAWAYGFDKLLNPVLLVLPGLALAAVYPPFFRYWSRVLLHKFKPGSPLPPVSGGLLLRSSAHYALVWVAYGSACGALALAVGSRDFALYFAAFPLAYLAGYAALFAPGGWGVREGALVWLCGGDACALAVSLLQRLVLTVFELVLFAFCVWSWRHD